MSKKGNAASEREGEVRPLVPGMPDIAHPRDNEKYEWQLSFIYDWFLTTLDRVESSDVEAATEACAELQMLFLKCVSQLLQLASKKQGSSANQWAHRILASIFVSIGKHAGKVRVKKPYAFLMGTNAAFRKEKKKLGKLRTDVLFPVLIGAITQRELRRAEHYRKRLLLLKAGCVSEPEHKRREALGVKSSTWEQAAKGQKIPEAYWDFVDLPEFSLKEKPFEQWCERLWPFIKKKIDIAKLDSQYKMARTRYRSDSQKTARDHLRTLAKLRDKGVYY